MPRTEIHTYKVLLLYTTYRRSEIHKVRDHIMKAKFDFGLYHFSVLELYGPWYGGNTNYDFRLITSVLLKQFMYYLNMVRNYKRNAWFYFWHATFLHSSVKFLSITLPTFCTFNHIIWNLYTLNPTCLTCHDHLLFCIIILFFYFLL